MKQIELLEFPKDLVLGLFHSQMLLDHIMAEFCAIKFELAHLILKSEVMKFMKQFF